MTPVRALVTYLELVTPVRAHAIANPRILHQLVLVIHDTEIVFVDVLDQVDIRYRLPKDLVNTQTQPPHTGPPREEIPSVRNIGILSTFVVDTPKWLLRIEIDR